MTRRKFFWWSRKKIIEGERQQGWVCFRKAGSNAMQTAALKRKRGEKILASHRTDTHHGHNQGTEIKNITEDKSQVLHGIGGPAWRDCGARSARRSAPRLHTHGSPVILKHTWPHRGTCHTLTRHLSYLGLLLFSYLATHPSCFLRTCPTHAYGEISSDLYGT